MTTEWLSEYTFLGPRRASESEPWDRPLCFRTNKQALGDESSGLKNSSLRDACFQFSGLIWQPKNLDIPDILSRI